MNDTREQGKVNQVIRSLSSPQRRRLIQYFREENRNHADRHELAQALADMEPDLESADAQLRHQHLPILEKSGLIEYDSRSEAVRLTDRVDTVQPLLDACLELEREFGEERSI